MLKKKIINFSNSKIGKAICISLTFLFLFILVSNNVGLSLRGKIILDHTLDFSWFTDSVERFLHGYIQGKDFTFTYGPLFQLVASLPSIIFHVPSYVSVALLPIVSFVLIFILVLFISRNITKNFFEQIAYILFLFLIVGLLSSGTDVIRVLMPIVYSLFFLEINKKKLQWSKFFLIVILPTIFGLYSYNLFVITFVFSVLFIAIKLYEQSRNQKVNFSLLLIPLAIIAFHLMFSLLFTHGLDYVFTSLDSVNNYRYLMDLPWAHDRSNVMFIFPVALVFIGIYLLKTKKISLETRKVMLILILNSFVGLISVLSRSDAGHLQFGIFPSMITFFTIIFILSKNNRGLIVVAFVFYLLVPVKPTFYNTFSLKNVYKVVQVIRDKPSFSNIYTLPQTYYSESEIKDLVKIVKENKGKVFIYPYDSYLLNVESTTYNSFALGLYTYSNSLVEERTVLGFVKDPPPVIILQIDTKGALDLDEIPNFTRNPLLARWIIKNYTVNKKNYKYLVLFYTPNKKITGSEKCLAHEISVNLTGKENFLQKIIDLVKPATYYLDEIRLPYSSSAKKYLVFNDIFTSSGVASLFDSKESISAGKSILDKNGNLQIIRVSAILGKKEVKIFNRNEFSIKCANFNN